MTLTFALRSGLAKLSPEDIKPEAPSASLSQELRISNVFRLMPCGLVAEGYATRDEWLEVGKLLVGLRDSVHWLIGDWLNYGMEQYDLTYEQAASLLNERGLVFTYQTLRNDKYVASRVPLSWRHDRLTWQHHKEVASLEPEQQRYWLSFAREMLLTTRELRIAIKGAAHLSWLRFSDVWNFSECDGRFGMESPGRIPGQIIQNLLHRYTQPCDFVIDPTATDGTTLDVCTRCNEVRRECLAFDVNPARPEVIRADATKPWPTKKRADLIFMNATCYSVPAPGQDFKLAMRKIFGNAAYHLNDGGILSILVAPRVMTNLYEDLTCEVFPWLKYDIGLEYLRRIVIPVSTREIESKVWAEARKNNHLVTQLRDLLIFRKRGVKKPPAPAGSERLTSLKCLSCGISIGPDHIETEGHQFADGRICSQCLRFLDKKGSLQVEDSEKTKNQE